MPRANCSAHRSHAATSPTGATQAAAALLSALVWAVAAMLWPGVVSADDGGSAFQDTSLLAMNETLRAPSQAESDWDDDDWLDDEFDLESEFDAMSADDPLEDMNRGIFAFNGQVDRFVLTPVTDVYQGLVPTAGRTGIHNVFVNFDTPSRLANALFQGRPKAAGITLGRFVFNTTFGLGGLFDVGSRIGLKKQRADFGQTLATWGVPSGAYLIFPLLGPMTLRGGVGTGVDLVMQPASWVMGPLPGMLMGASKDFTRREQNVFELEILRDASLDFYAALRSAFLQDRADLIAAGEHDSSIDELASTGSDPALSAEEREANCLAQPRARREVVKPGLRAATLRRCSAAR